MRTSVLRPLLFAGLWLLALAAWGQQVPAFQWATQTERLLLWNPILAPTLYNEFYTQASAGVVRYSAQGVQRRVLPIRRISLLDLRTDGGGNVYGVGKFYDSARVGTTTLTTTANHVGYVVCKWDSSGALQWFQQGNQPERARIGMNSVARLAIDSQGSVILTSLLDTITSFGTTVIPAPADRRGTFCIKFAANGTLRWAKWSSGHTRDVLPGDVAIDPLSGDVLLTLRQTLRSFRWGSRTLPPLPQNNRLIRLAANTGDILNDVPTPIGYLGVASICVDQDGYCYLAGGSPGGVVTKLDPMGVTQWTRFSALPNMGALGMSVALGPPPTGSSQPASLYVFGTYKTDLPYDLLGAMLPASVPIGIYHNEDGYIAGLDPATGSALWALPTATGGYFSTTDKLVTTEDGSLLISGVVQGPAIRFGSVSLAFPGTTSTDYKLYVAKAPVHYNQITGAVYVDYDSTTSLSPADRAFENCVVQTQPENFFFATDTTGRYGTVITQMGTSRVTLPEVPLYHTLPATPPAPAAFSNFGNVAPDRDFRLQPVPGQQDLQVFVTPLTEDALRGGPLRYQIYYRNIGTTTESGTVTFRFDPGLSYVSNTGGATLSGSTLTLPYANLRPGQGRSFEVELLVPATPPFSGVHATGTIEPVGTDLTPDDNSDSPHVRILTADDPFGVYVNPAVIYPTQVAYSPWLDYTIFFNNEGTDTVSSVLLLDSLPVAQYRMGSLDLLTASHPCRWRLSPTGVLTATLTGARLTPRAANARRSAGFARFRVRVAPTLQLGDAVVNRARVHFDARPVVVPAPAVTTVQVVTGLSADAAGAAVQVWPNPASGALHVALPETGTTLTLLDAVGRPVLTQTATARETTLDIRTLPTGLYLLRGQTATGEAFTRRVVLR